MERYPWHTCNVYCNESAHCDLVYTDATLNLEQIETAEERLRWAYAHHHFVTVVRVESAPAVTDLRPLALRSILDPEAPAPRDVPEGAHRWLVWWVW